MGRVSRVYFPVTALGPGRRLGVWFQGCPIACRGCMSRDTWPAEGGVEVPSGWLVELWREAVGRGATGVTISGGEPSEQPNALLEILTAIRVEQSQLGVPEADILVYTGRERDDFAARVPGALGLADALITGPYRVELPTTLIWRGSANQQLHLLSELGRQRFGPFIDHRPEKAPLQVLVDERAIHYVGVPRRGDLTGTERDLRSAGIQTGRTTWRS